MTVLRQMIDLLSRRERVQLGLLFVAVLIMALLEMISVASVLPFLSVAADPGQIQSNAWLSWAYHGLGFTSTSTFLLVLAGASLFALVLSNAWMATTHWAQLRFARERNHRFGVQLLRRYLAQPYVFFLRRNSAALSKNILSEVEQVSSILSSGLRLTAKSLVALAIIVLLFLYDPRLALFVTAVLGGAYGAIYLQVRNKLGRLGKERIASNGARYKATAEAFGAIKDIKLLGKEQELVAHFISPSKRFNHCQAMAAIMGEIPRYMLDVLAFGGVLLIAIYLILRGEGLQQTIPVLGLYAFAGYRLMPSLQQVFAGYTRLRFGAPALDNLHLELSRLSIASGAAIRPTNTGGCAEQLSLTKRLELDAVSFTYPDAHTPALCEISVVIEANSTVGIVGPTGSGKTTMVDVILGLLRPQSGEIRVDGVPLTEANLRAWQDRLGYVPQHIYLSDDTVARNIAFGVPDEQIDVRAVERAAQIANIHRFITDDLPGGYATIVGERGIRLSGGQRQRIGIARALYLDPPVLVLDEATSALDMDTEAAVMEAIQELAGRKTILLVTHRLATTRHCNVVCEIERGVLVRQHMRQEPTRIPPVRAELGSPSPCAIRL